MRFFFLDFFNLQGIRPLEEGDGLRETEDGPRRSLPRDLQPGLGSVLCASSLPSFCKTFHKSKSGQQEGEDRVSRKASRGNYGFQSGWIYCTVMFQKLTRVGLTYSLQNGSQTLYFCEKRLRLQINVTWSSIWLVNWAILTSMIWGLYLVYLGWGWGLVFKFIQGESWSHVERSQDRRKIREETEDPARRLSGKSMNVVYRWQSNAVLYVAWGFKIINY